MQLFFVLYNFSDDGRPFFFIPGYLYMCMYGYMYLFCYAIVFTRYKFMYCDVCIIGFSTCLRGNPGEWRLEKERGRRGRIHKGHCQRSETSGIIEVGLALPPLHSTISGNGRNISRHDHINHVLFTSIRA